MIHEPCGAFYFIRLYADCGENYFTPVGEFDSRELPDPRATGGPVPERMEKSGSGNADWAEYTVIAPDHTRSHYDPLVNWARRTWTFNGTSYGLTAVGPLN